MTDKGPTDGSQQPIKGFSNEPALNVSEDQSQKEIINQYNHHIEKLKEDFNQRLQLTQTECQEKDNYIIELQEELENVREEREDIFNINQDLQRNYDNLEAEKKRLDEKIKQFREGGDSNAVNVLNLLDFPQEKISTYETTWTDEVRIWKKEVHVRSVYPSEEHLTDRNLQQLQPIRFGLNGRAMVCQFGNLNEEVFGKTMSDLNFQCVIDQLCTDPVCHVNKIRLRKTRYSGQEFGTHVEVEFLSAQNYILGKFENVDSQKVVEKNWVQLLGWEKKVLEEKIICTLKDDDQIVGVEVGISNIDEQKNFVESLKFKIAHFKLI